MTDPAYLNRNHPAHHAPLARHNTPVIVQVSVCTKDRLPVLACEAGHRLCREVWQTADFWRVGQYVIMPDHIHLFCASGRVPPTSLRQWVAFWKSLIAAQWPGGAGEDGGSGSVPTGYKDDTEVVPPSDDMEMDDTAVVPPGGGLGGSGFVPTGYADDTETDDTEVVPPGGGLGGSGAVPTASGFKLWQRDFWDTQMRSREHYAEKLSYVRMNPVRKGLSIKPEAWPYQGQIFPIAWL